MAVSVEHIIKEIIRREGGYVNHPNDRGGPTKYGVHRNTLKIPKAGCLYRRCKAYD